MTRDAFLLRLRRQPLIVSVQAAERTPMDHEETLARLARASAAQGISVMRLEGIKANRHIRPQIGKTLVIGLLKRRYPDSDVYITPTKQDADAMVAEKCNVIAIDGTDRPRPHGQTRAEIISHLKKQRVLVMADCDTYENALAAAAEGADLIGTTLAGYTDTPSTIGPDLELVRRLVQAGVAPVIAEGRYAQRWQIEAALRMGAVAVTVGGAVNDPVKNTRALSPRRMAEGVVAAFDIGGTWLRFAPFGPDWKPLEEPERTPFREMSALDRLVWMTERVRRCEATVAGVSTGGIVDPRTNTIWRAKEYLMPGHAGARFDETTLGVPTFAYGDGHAAAWAHANRPEYAGTRVGTLSLGTGLGAGFVAEGRILAGPRGEYPRFNDLAGPRVDDLDLPQAVLSDDPEAGSIPGSLEHLLGGLNLGIEPGEAQKEAARRALGSAVCAMEHIMFPDHLVVGGTVGMADWLREDLLKSGAHPSPFGPQAGLYGAAALALFPSWRD